MALTRIFSGPSSMASVLTKPMIAHFAAVYGARSGQPKRPAVEDMQIKEPPPAARSKGTARRAQ
jgi:hypothetical protein